MSEPNLANNKHLSLPLSVDITITTLLNKVTNSTTVDVQVRNIKQLYDSCIESKHTKIVKHKKMTSTTLNLQEIHTNLLGLHDPTLLSGRTSIGFILDEFN